jgi:hypothetical protein
VCKVYSDKERERKTALKKHIHLGKENHRKLGIRDGYNYNKFWAKYIDEHLMIG